MLHTLVYTANTFNNPYFDSMPVQDTWVPISNNHYLPPQPLNLYGGWFGGPNLQAVILTTPKTRMVAPPRLYPIQGTNFPPDRPHIWDRRANPFGLNAIEEIALMMNLGGSVAATTYAVLFVGDSLLPVPPGDVYNLHGTSVTPAVPNQWTQLQVIWDQNLPAGSYTIIGSQVQSTNAVAHRWSFRGSVMKPGFLSLQNITNITDPSWYFGGWGALGTFQTLAYPFVEVLCSAADNAHDVNMNMIKTG